jgi:glutathione S-transferase
VRGQLFAALNALELEINGGKGWLFEDRMMLADITLATAFAFTQSYLADIVDKAPYGAIASFSARAEETAEFRAAPAADGVLVSTPAR